MSKKRRRRPRQHIYTAAWLASACPAHARAVLNSSENSSIRHNAMPLSRHGVANEHCRKAGGSRPEAILEGAAMDGLVGVLRQLGDLAEFAAEVFHGLHDEATSTSARGHGLMLRVMQLEAELPHVEKDFCQKEDYLDAAPNEGVDWHADVKMDHGVVTRGGTPRFIMEYIKHCHGPPRLFMLDKYDIDGEGACLKRYTNASFFRTDSACSSMLQEGIQREKRPLKVMEIRPNLQNSEIFKPPNAANTASTLETDLSDEASDGISSMRRQLKYRHLNRSVFRRLRPQMQNLYEEDSLEEKAPSMDYSEENMTDVYTDGCKRYGRMESCKACSEDCNATSRSSSFWKKGSPMPYYSDATSVNRDEPSGLQEEVKPVTGGHERTSSSELGMTEQVIESNYNGFVSNAASNGSTLESIKNCKESNIATFSFKKMASKRSKYSDSLDLVVLELKYDGTQDTYDFEPKDKEYEIDEKRSFMSRVPSELAQEDDVSSECGQPEHVVALEPTDGLVILDQDDDLAYEGSPDVDEGSKEGSFYYEKADLKFALADASTEQIEEQLVSDGVIISSPSSLEQSDREVYPLAPTDEHASNHIDNYSIETESADAIAAETGLTTMDTQSIASNYVAVPDNEQCYIYPETTFVKNTKHLPSEDTVEELHESDQPLRQEPNSFSNPCFSSKSTATCGDHTFVPDSRALPLQSISSFAWMLNGAMLHQPLSMVPPLPPLPPMQWRAAKLQAGPVAASGKLGRLPRLESPTKHGTNECDSSLRVKTQEAEMVRASQHNSLNSQSEMAPTSVSNGSICVDFSHTNPSLNRVPEEICCRDALGENGSEEHESSEQKGKGVSAEDNNTMPASEVNKFSNGVPIQDDAQSSNLSTRHKSEERISSEHNEREFRSANEELVRIPPLPPPAPRPPRSPLFEVTSHDRRMLRKAPTMVQTLSMLSNEQNTLLEQIKNKSFNLKPVLARRPNVMCGPPTNLKVVAILERANVIRQAIYENDDDEDSWSE